MAVDGHGRHGDALDAGRQTVVERVVRSVDLRHRMQRSQEVVVEVVDVRR